MRRSLAVEMVDEHLPVLGFVLPAESLEISLGLWVVIEFVLFPRRCPSPSDPSTFVVPPRPSSCCSSKAFQLP